MARFTVRVPNATLQRLDTLACSRGTTRAGLVRQLVDAAVQGVPAPDVDPPNEAELLDLLAEKARAGNVSAIRTLLARQEQLDPQERALRSFEVMVEGRRQ